MKIKQIRKKYMLVNKYTFIYYTHIVLNIYIYIYLHVFILSTFSPGIPFGLNPWGHIQKVLHQKSQKKVRNLLGGGIDSIDILLTPAFGNYPI